MHGYYVHHELQINRNAEAARRLAAEIECVVEETEALSHVKDWNSAASYSQTAEIKKKLVTLRRIAAELNSIGNDMNAFTDAHKTWLEEIEEFVEDVIS